MSAKHGLKILDEEKKLARVEEYGQLDDLRMFEPIQYKDLSQLHKSEF